MAARLTSFCIGTQPPPWLADAAHLTRSYAIGAATYIDATLDPSNVRKEGRAQ